MSLDTKYRAAVSSQPSRQALQPLRAHRTLYCRYQRCPRVVTSLERILYKVEDRPHHLLHSLHHSPRKPLRPRRARRRATTTARSRHIDRMYLAITRPHGDSATSSSSAWDFTVRASGCFDSFAVPCSMNTGISLSILHHRHAIQRFADIDQRCCGQGSRPRRIENCECTYAFFGNTAHPARSGIAGPLFDD